MPLSPPAADAAAPAGRSGRPAPARRRAGLLGAVAATLLSLLAACLALELWKSRLSVPFRYPQVGDVKFYLGLVKGILEHGWFQSNPSLGAPFGQTLYDFPQGADNLNFLVIKLLGLASSDYAVVTNLFFLLTFPLTGLAAYYALHRYGLGPPAAVVCAVLFALLPFHFYRNESQLLLSAYYAVPLGALLFLSVASGRPLLARRRAGPRALTWASGRTLETLGSCLVIGSAGLYYAVFTLLLLAAATVGALVARRGSRAIVACAAAGAMIGLTLGANLAPSLLYVSRHGVDGQIARTPIESEQLGLRLSNLVLPVSGHRLEPLARVNARYAAATSPGYCESCNETLGAVGAAGFVLLCLVGLAAGAAGGSESSRLEWQRAYRPAALGAAVAVAVGTIGGLSALIAFLVTPDVRAWNRISVFIAFFSLLAAGLLLEATVRRVLGDDRPAGRRALAGSLVAAVLVLGGLDETSTFFVPSYAAAARDYASDQAFGRLIQSRLPPGAAVLELPYLPYPEGYHVAGKPAADAFSASYDLLRPYLNTHGLRWSFGAIKGRPGDWERALADKSLDVVAAGAAAAGFQAIYVDPRGYVPAVAQQVRAGLTGLLGAGPLASARRDAWLFDLRPYRRALTRRGSPAALTAVGEATLHPLRTACGSTPADLSLVNPSAAVRPAALTATLAAPLPGGVTLLIVFPDGSSEQRAVGATPVTLDKRLGVAPGRSVVHFSLLGRRPFGAGPATPAFVVSEPTLTDEAFAPFRRRAALSGARLPVAGLVGPTCSDLYAASAGAHFSIPGR